MWIFFLSWPYEGREKFSWIILVSILMIFAGSIWFVLADHDKNGINLIDGRAFRTKRDEDLQEKEQS